MTGFSGVWCNVSLSLHPNLNILEIPEAKELGIFASSTVPGWPQAGPSAGLVLYMEAEPGFYGNTARVEGK